MLPVRRALVLTIVLYGFDRIHRARAHDLLVIGWWRVKLL